ncbi:MAG: hypothetical protein R2856_19830 [Caldilineaceae bacterium]
MDEGANCTDQAVGHIAFATSARRSHLRRAPINRRRAGSGGLHRGRESLHLNLPNDLFNNFRRRIHTPTRARDQCPVNADACNAVDGDWLNVEDKIGLVPIYGGDHFVFDRSPQRRGGRYASLFVDEICLQVERTTTRRAPHDTICDVGFVVTSGLDSLAVSQISGDSLIFEPVGVRGVSVLGQDGVRRAGGEFWGRGRRLKCGAAGGVGRGDGGGDSRIRQKGK